jgi:Fe(3+) dicitrate transport protein
MNLKPKMTALAVMAAFATVPTISFAEEAVVAETIAVTGILPSNLEAVPGSFNVVDEEELEARRPFSIQEALNHVPGINIVGESAFGMGVNIGVRGLDPRRTARTLLMEDGMPLFLAPYADPAAHYTTPLERVSRIEVVKGSGQILNGPQTAGGMINFVTKPVPTDGFAGSVTAKAGNNDYQGGHVNMGYGGDWGGIMIDALQNQGDGIRDNHDFEQREFTIKGQFNLTDRQTLIAKAGYYEEDSHVSETGLGAVEYAEDKFQAPSGDNDEFEQERKSYQLQHIFQISDNLKLSTQAYYVDTFRRSFRQIDEPGFLAGRSGLEQCNGVEDITPATEANADNCGGRHRPRSFEYFGFEPRMDIRHSLFGIESDAVIGFRYHEDKSTRKQFRGDTAASQSYSFAKENDDLREDLRIDVVAKSYYGQNTFYVGNWSLTPGIRIEDLKYKTNIRVADEEFYDFDYTHNQTVVLPGFGAAWNGIANTTIFAGVHKGFAPPRPDRDIFEGDEDEGTPANLDNTKPEESLNWELGVRSSYYKGITFESTLFYTDYREIVVQSAPGRFDNGGKSEMAGLEFAGRMDFGTIYNTAHNFYVSGSYTNLFTAEFKTDGALSGENPMPIESGNRLPYAPRHIASVSFGYQHPVGVDARIGVDYVSQQYVDGLNTRVESLDGREGTVPSYTLLNAAVNFKPVGSKATYFISGSNLADREYLATRVDGKAVGRGRQVFGGIRYDF